MFLIFVSTFLCPISYVMLRPHKHTHTHTKPESSSTLVWLRMDSVPCSNYQIIYGINVFFLPAAIVLIRQNFGLCNHFIHSIHVLFQFREEERKNITKIYLITDLPNCSICAILIGLFVYFVIFIFSFVFLMLLHICIISIIVVVVLTRIRAATCCHLCMEDLHRHSWSLQNFWNWKYSTFICL